MRKSNALYRSFLVVAFLFASIFFLSTSYVSAASQATNVYDDADLLTDDEEVAISSRISEFEKDTKTSLIVCTIPTLDGKTPSEYGRIKCLDLGLKNSAIVLVNMEYDNPSNRNISILSFKDDTSKTTNAYDNLTEERGTKIAKSISEYFTKGTYYKGISVAIDKIEDKVNSNPINDNLFAKSWMQLIIAVVLATIIVSVMAINSGGKVTANQRTYLNQNTSRVLGSYDHYVRTSTTRHKRESSSSSSGGGSSSSGGGGSCHGGSSGF